MRQNQLLIIACIYLLAASIAFATDEFPKAPDLELTPGALCLVADEIRYPEKINYCERDVSTGKKWAVINRYTKKFHFTISEAQRPEFKIDHYIPLCMGGANVVENLWPQHSTIFHVTDALEEILCEAMSLGKMSQVEAVEKIKKGKNDLTQAPIIIRETKLLIGE